MVSRRTRRSETTPFGGRETYELKTANLSPLSFEVHPQSGLQGREAGRGSTLARHCLGGGKLPEAKRDFVLLPRRWVVERSFVEARCFRRLVKDYERCARPLADLHLVAFVRVTPRQFARHATGLKQSLALSAVTLTQHRLAKTAYYWA